MPREVSGRESWTLRCRERQWERRLENNVAHIIHGSEFRLEL